MLALSPSRSGAPPASARSKPPFLSRRLPLTLRHPPPSERGGEEKGGGGSGCWGPPGAERGGAEGREGGRDGWRQEEDAGVRWGGDRGGRREPLAAYLPSSCLRTI